MSKQMMFDEEGRAKVLAGIKKLAQALKTTLGPGARTVLLDKKFGKPESVNDGATVAKEIELEDPFENVGVKLVNSVAEKTNDTAGDGTTTATVLAEAIYVEGLKAISSGVTSQGLTKGIEKAVKFACEEFKKSSRSVRGIEDYRRVATIASNNDEVIGELVAEAIDRVKKEGVVTVEEGKTRETKVEFVEGLDFDKGFISPYFINKPESLTCELEDAYILLSDKKISNLPEFVPILERVAQTGKPVLVICEEMEGEALAALVVNRLRGILNSCAVKAPTFGDRRKAILQDIAIVTGGNVVSDDLGIKLDTLKLKDLGRAKNIKIEKERTTIIEGAGSRKSVEARVNEIRTLIKKTTSDYDREKYEERLAKLIGGVAIVKVGGTTEQEMKEKKYRVDDAVNATKASIEEGVVAGGGIVYLRASQKLADLNAETPDEKAGIKIIASALEKPIFNITANAGLDGNAIVAEAKERPAEEGFDVLGGKWVNMFDAGIVDAAKVARLALTNAASVASLLLTTRAVITEIKEKEKEKKPVAGALT